MIRQKDAFVRYGLRLEVRLLASLKLRPLTGGVTLDNFGLEESTAQHVRAFYESFLIHPDHGDALSRSRTQSRTLFIMYGKWTSTFRLAHLSLTFPACGSS